MADDPWFAVVAEPELIDSSDGDAIQPTLPDHRAVHCRDVSKWFGPFPALRDVTIDIERGEVVSIIGRSGSGKSTFIRCLNRLERHDAGVISVLGLTDPDDPFETRLLREQVGMVFQEFNLFPMLTVEQNVTAALRLVHRRPAEEARSIARRMLERVDMARHGDKRPSQLSGGEQQRVAIARTLAMGPRIILLDEPTASIDPELTKGIMDLIADIARDEVTIIAVTHEMGFAKRSSDRIVFFDRGRILEDAPPEKIFDLPDHPETRRFLLDARLTSG